MGIVILRGVWKGLVVLFLAAALILGATVLSGKAHAGPGGDSQVYYDENDATWATVEFLRGLRDMGDKYGVGMVVKVELLPDPDMAAGVPHYTNIVYINETYAERPDWWSANAEEAVAVGYLPEGCPAVYMNGVHEFGHVLDNHQGRRATEFVRTHFQGQVFTGVLPGYSLKADGTLNPSEALANAFAAVECGSANQMERDLYRILIG